MPELVFSARDLELRYGRGRDSRPALAIASLEVRRGERLALVGPNGSGKTSLLKLLNGLVVPSSGMLSLFGRDLGTSPDLRSLTVYLHQQPFLLAGSVSYNVAFGCRGRGLSRPLIDKRVEEGLELVGLSGLGRRRHRALSGGEAQRVALARALAMGAEVLLLDEPTSSADAESVLLVRQALDAASRRGVTIVFSTHDPGLARDLATGTLRLEAGRVVDDSRSQADRRDRT